MAARPARRGAELSFACLMAKSLSGLGPMPGTAFGARHCGCRTKVVTTYSTQASDATAVVTTTNGFRQSSSRCLDKRENRDGADEGKPNPLTAADARRRAKELGCRKDRSEPDDDRCEPRRIPTRPQIAINATPKLSHPTDAAERIDVQRAAPRRPMLNLPGRLGRCWSIPACGYPVAARRSSCSSSSSHIPPRIVGGSSRAMSDAKRCSDAGGTLPSR